ncbi:hypothetical protein N203_03240 [Helicobacter pylori UM084]|nr:hypothetical protein N203_03240 [Helicobacter pylori UM084]
MITLKNISCEHYRLFLEIKITFENNQSKKSNPKTKGSVLNASLVFKKLS